MKILRILVAWIFLHILSHAIAAIEPSPSLLAPEVKKSISEDLKKCEPSKSIQEAKTEEDKAILCGDIFKVGRQCALIEIKDGMCYCEWTKGQWIPVLSWKIEIEYLAKQEAEEQFGDAKPAEKAFTPITIAKGIEGVKISGEVGKYVQYFHILYFNKLKGVPEIAGTTVNPPKVFDGYAILYTCSPRLAEWENWDYFKIENGTLNHIASWNEYTPVNNPDDQTITVERFAGRHHAYESFDIKYPSETDKEPGIKITGPVNGRLVVTARSKEKQYPDWCSMEEAYLFEKLTGIPRSLYHITEEDHHQEARLEDVAKITVVGDKAAIARLSPERKWPWLNR